MTDQNIDWCSRGKSIEGLIAELRSFEDQSLEVRLSLDEGQTSYTISLVGKFDNRCLLVNYEEQPRGQRSMKNIQIIDGAENCTFSVFQATDEEFSLIFPAAEQDIEFAEDLAERLGDAVGPLSALWERPILKQDVIGIHGTLFYDFGPKRHLFPATKRARDWDSAALNAAQRRLYSEPQT